MSCRMRLLFMTLEYRMSWVLKQAEGCHVCLVKQHLALYTSQLRHCRPLSLQSASAHESRSPNISATFDFCSSIHQCACQSWRDKGDHQQHPCTYGALCLTLKDQPSCRPLLNYNLHKRAALPSLTELLSPARPLVNFTTTQ